MSAEMLHIMHGCSAKFNTRVVLMVRMGLDDGSHVYEWHNVIFESASVRLIMLILCRMFSFQIELSLFVCNSFKMQALFIVMHTFPKMMFYVDVCTNV